MFVPVEHFRDFGNQNISQIVRRLTRLACLQPLLRGLDKSV